MSKVTSIPQLRFPEFSGEWKEKKLSDVAEIVGGGTPPTAVEKYWGGDIQWFTPTEIKNKYIVNSKRTITQVGLDTSSARLLPKGTLLFSSRATVGEIGIAVQECTTNQGFQSFIVNKDNDSEFLYNWIIKNKKEFIRRASGSTFLEIGKSEIKKIKSNIPLLSEQQKIAAFLTAVDSKIEQLSKKQELLGEYKKGLMEQIFSQAIRFKANDGSDFPDWEEKKLGDLSVVISDGNYGELYPTSSDFKLTGVPFLRANNIKSLKIDGTDTKYITEEQHSLLTSGHLQTNDILITTRGVLGNLAIVESTHNGSNINAQICLLRVTNTSELNHFYLLFVLDHRDSKKQYKAFETGTALKQLPKGNLRKIKLKLPTLFEQNKIANFLSSIDTKIEQVGKQLDESKQFKKALLQQMFV